MLQQVKATPEDDKKKKERKEKNLKVVQYSEKFGYSSYKHVQSYSYVLTQEKSMLMFTQKSLHQRL